MISKVLAELSFIKEYVAYVQQRSLIIQALMSFFKISLRG